MKIKKEKCALILIIGFLLFSIGFTAKSEPKIIQKSSSAVDLNDLLASANQIMTKKEVETDNPFLMDIDLEVTPASVQKTPVEIYESMSIQEREAALYAGTLHMEYSALYTYSGERLSTSKGAQYYNGHKETYYSERVLPGTTLNIPGRHVAEDGTVRDGDGFICVAADPGFMPKGSTLITSLGPAKVYDTGCAYGIIDLYVNW